MTKYRSRECRIFLIQAAWHEWGKGRRGGKGRWGLKMTRFVRRDASAAATNNAPEKREGENKGEQRVRLLGSFHRRLLLYIFMFSSSSSLLVFRLGSQPKNYWRAHTITTN